MPQRENVVVPRAQPRDFLPRSLGSGQECQAPLFVEQSVASKTHGLSDGCLADLANFPA
jgi:hypothetical protein